MGDNLSSEQYVTASGLLIGRCVCLHWVLTIWCSVPCGECLYYTPSYTFYSLFDSVFCQPAVGGIVETHIKAKCSQTKREKKKLKNTPQLTEHRQLRGIISITAGILSLPKNKMLMATRRTHYLTRALFCCGVWWSGGILASMSACSGI